MEALKASALTGVRVQVPSSARKFPTIGGIVKGSNGANTGNSGGQGNGGSGRRFSLGNLVGKHSGVIIHKVGNLDRYGSQ